MELTYHGANYVELATKQARLGIDPIVPGLSLNRDRLDIVAYTSEQTATSVKEGQLLLATPGEYEARGISIHGISARSHSDEEGKHSATMFRIVSQGVRLGVVGHIYPELSDDQLEALGMVDVLVIPVGGSGYTLDAEGAARVVRAIEPKVVIPTHYADNDITYEVPQHDLKEFLDEIGAPMQEEIKYKMKDGVFPEQLTVVVLARTT